MKNIIFPLLAGVFIALQGVFNTRVSEKIGLWEANTFVHGTGFIFTVILLFITGDGNFYRLGEVNKVYLFGGMLGTLIVYTVVQGMASLGAVMTTAILLVTQLITATVIDTFGLFGNQPIKFDYTKLVGIAVMIAGIVIFKARG
jgi:transporter family-2 protein